ncbi:MAG: DUF928 domain-containing protein [Cyanobacteria bacterium J007]|nr:MAG: DUF928 domain-containing protein [Cyanobacteria bacterium J007]
MAWKFFHIFATWIFLSTAFGLSTLSLDSRPVRAQGTVTTESEGLTTEWNSFEPPDRGTPGRRVGGGTRSRCPRAALELTALVPETNLGRTVAAYPTLFFYVPGIPNSSEKVEFELVDANDPDRVLYKSLVSIPERGGTIAISVPDDGSATPLEPDTYYNWYLSFECDPNMLVGGWIERVELATPLQDELEAASPGDRLAIYEREGLWYDLLAELFQLRQDRPADPLLEARWQQLLATVKLDDRAEEPLLDLPMMPLEAPDAPNEEF